MNLFSRSRGKNDSDKIKPDPVVTWAMTESARYKLSTEIMRRLANGGLPLGVSLSTSDESAIRGAIENALPLICSTFVKTEGPEVVTLESFCTSLASSSNLKTRQLAASFLDNSRPSAAEITLGFLADKLYRADLACRPTKFGLLVDFADQTNQAFMSAASSIVERIAWNAFRLVILAIALLGLVVGAPLARSLMTADGESLKQSIVDSATVIASRFDWIEHQQHYFSQLIYLGAIALVIFGTAKLGRRISN